MRIVIVGAAGYLGHPLMAAASDAVGIYHAGGKAVAGCPAIDLQQAHDFDYGFVRQGDVILLTSGISSPDRCAADPLLARAVNVEGTLEFILRAVDRGVKVIFFSTDAVYGEQPEPFDERQPCRPIGVYAEMKHEVEERVTEVDAVKVIRLSYVFSRADGFTAYLCRCADAGEIATLYTPFRRAVIHRGDVVEGALALARNWSKYDANVINFGGPTVLDRPEFATTLATTGWPRLRWQAAAAPDEFFRNRARAINMQSPLLKDLLGRPPRSFAEACGIEFALAAHSGL